MSHEKPPCALGFHQMPCECGLLGVLGGFMISDYKAMNCMFDIPLPSCPSHVFRYFLCPHSHLFFPLSLSQQGGFKVEGLLGH